MLFYTKVDTSTELLVNGIRKLSMSKFFKIILNTVDSFINLKKNTKY